MEEPTADELEWMAENEDFEPPFPEDSYEEYETEKVVNNDEQEVVSVTTETSDRDKNQPFSGLKSFLKLSDKRSYGLDKKGQLPPELPTKSDVFQSRKIPALAPIHLPEISILPKGIEESLYINRNIEEPIQSSDGGEINEENEKKVHRFASDVEGAVFTITFNGERVYSQLREEKVIERSLMGWRAFEKHLPKSSAF